jgi:hypothetical protein
MVLKVTWFFAQKEEKSSAYILRIQTHVVFNYHVSLSYRLTISVLLICNRRALW